MANDEPNCRSRSVALLALFVVAGCSSVLGVEPLEVARSPVFAPRKMISAGGVVGTRGLAVADLDGDGYTDVLATSEYEGEVFWFRNNRGAGFAEGVVITDTFASALTVNAADLNGDGLADVVVGGDQRVEWYENSGGGKFKPGRLLDNDLPKIIRVSLSDLDGDGDLDIISASKWKVSWFQNRGSGSFAPPIVVNSAVTHVNWTDAADFNGDRRPDIFAISYEYEFPEIREDPSLPARIGKGDSLVWHANLGDGRFGPAQTVDSEPGVIQSHTRPGDIDGDGRADLISCHLLANRIVWYRNQGSSFSKARTVTEKIDGPEAIVIADVDLDGDNDVISAALFDGMFRLHPNLGKGLFGDAEILVRDANGPIAIEVADVDHDGDLDVIAAAEMAGSVFWFENTTRAAASK